MGNEEFTGAHYDVVYMGRGTPRLYTSWTPIGDAPLEDGPLADSGGAGCKTATGAGEKQS